MTRKPQGKKEDIKMMSNMIVNNMMNHNMANMMAEDVGLYELRNPAFSGMRAKGWFSRLISRIYSR